MHELHERGFLAMEGGKNGQPPTVRLLDESGSGAGYELPYLDGDVSYVRVPHQLWTQGLIGELKGPGLAVYLCVLSHYNHDASSQEIWFSKKGFHDLHGLGETTRLSGTTELLDAGVLTAREVSIDSTGGSDFRTHRRRMLSVEQPFVPPPPADRPRA
ncbi:hypothetical protein ACFWPX_33255 [Nocardia sp. NPDC058518]|uniref:hypothetical protein n=1 Tax=Nocardia sp. NPDC058518 TaxID=3346534 RepID=UPI003659916D